jgi:hypothetical protein
VQPVSWLCVFDIEYVIRRALLTTYLYIQEVNCLDPCDLLGDKGRVDSSNFLGVPDEVFEELLEIGIVWMKGR